MKTRTSFVANSSSSSFIIYRDKIDVDQLNAILNYVETARRVVSKKIKNDLMEEGYSSDTEDSVKFLEFSNEYLKRLNENKDIKYLTSPRWTPEFLIDGNLRMWTNMNNFDFRWFLEEIMELKEEKHFMWEDF